MTTAQVVIDKMVRLPEARQREVLDFVEFLESKETTVRKPRKSALGICADLKFDLTDEDFQEARKEMWGNFPRDIS